jgi:hypothetical protein
MISSGARSGLAALLAAAVLVGGATAHAQSEGERKQATALQAEGLRLMQKGDNKAALAKFQEAYRLVPSPKIMFNMGRAHRNLGADIEALGEFERFLDESPYAPKESRDEAERAVESLRMRLAYIEVQADDGAQVSIDSKDAGMAPLAKPVVVLPGPHEVHVEKPGMTPETRSVSPIAGQKVRVSVRLASAPPAQPPAPPVPVSPSGPNPEGLPSAMPAPAPGTPPPPPAMIRQPTPVPPQHPWQVTAAWTSVGVGTAALGFGIAFQLLSAAKNTDFNNVTDAPNPSGLCNQKLANSGGGPCQNLVDEANNRFTLALVGYASSAVAFGAGLYFYLSMPSTKAEAKELSAVCLPGLDGTGGLRCGLTGRF